MLEKDLERAVVNHCKMCGFVTYKFSSPSQRGVPDRIVIGPGGTLFLELKQFGKKPTKLQLHHIQMIKNAGGNADWADNILYARERINAICS